MLNATVTHRHHTPHTGDHLLWRHHTLHPPKRRRRGALLLDTALRIEVNGDYPPALHVHAQDPVATTCSSQWVVSHACGYMGHSCVTGGGIKRLCRASASRASASSRTSVIWIRAESRYNQCQAAQTSHACGLHLCILSLSKQAPPT